MDAAQFTCALRVAITTKHKQLFKCIHLTKCARGLRVLFEHEKCGGKTVWIYDFMNLLDQAPTIYRSYKCHRDF